MPWHVSADDSFSPVNAQSGRAYRGVNCLGLWAIARSKAYSSAYWGTYRQWRELGAQVREGETAAVVVFWKVTDKEEESEEREETRRIFFAQGYSVFNASQVDGFAPPEVPLLSVRARIVEAEQFRRALPADIRHGGNSAFYDPVNDRIQLPAFERFRDAVSYYAVLAHELTHWTGAPQRLNRDLSTRFGPQAYAAEELIAELGAAFQLAHLKLANTPRPEHAHYLSTWLQLLKNDNRAIFTAASRAQQAVDHLVSLQQTAAQQAA
jgi:antirestriction protein ArdC